METWQRGDIVEYKNSKGRHLILELTGPIQSLTVPGKVISDSAGTYEPGHEDKWTAGVFILVTPALTADTVLQQLDKLEEKYHGI